MAEKRMFTKKITDSDAFLEMPLSSHALYFHLNMQADDDGFVNNPRKIQRSIGASEDDLKLLLLKRFVIGFDTGVVVIKHWRMHNLLRKDRYNPTQYVEEFNSLMLNKNGSYTEKNEQIFDEITDGNQMATKWQPNGNQMATQYRLGKNKITTTTTNTRAHAREEENGNLTVDVEKSVENSVENVENANFSEKTMSKPVESNGIPTLDEVRAYFAEKQIDGSPEKFYDYNKRKNADFKRWKDYADTWGVLERREAQSGGFQVKKAKQKQAGFDVDEFFDANLQRGLDIANEVLKKKKEQE